MASLTWDDFNIKFYIFFLRIRTKIIQNIENYFIYDSVRKIKICIEQKITHENLHNANNNKPKLLIKTSPNLLNINHKELSHFSKKIK